MHKWERRTWSERGLRRTQARGCGHGGQRQTVSADYAACAQDSELAYVSSHMCTHTPTHATQQASAPTNTHGYTRPVTYTEARARARTARHARTTPKRSTDVNTKIHGHESSHTRDSYASPGQPLQHPCTPPPNNGPLPAPRLPLPLAPLSRRTQFASGKKLSVEAPRGPRKMIVSHTSATRQRCPRKSITRAPVDTMETRGSFADPSPSR